MVHGQEAGLDAAKSIGKDPNYMTVHAMAREHIRHEVRREEIVRYQSSLMQWDQEGRSLHRSPKRWDVQPRAPVTVEIAPTKLTATRRCPKRVGKHGKVRFNHRGADTNQS